MDRDTSDDVSRRQREKPTPTGPRAREEIALAEAVAQFRKLANLHDACPDRSLVDYAFGAGEEKTGAEDVREAATALETARRATIDPRDAPEVGSGRGEAVDVRSELLS